MEIEQIPKYKKINNRDICINAKQVLEHIQTTFPHENYQTIALRARVHPQTPFRWVSKGLAKGAAIRRLITSFGSEEDNNLVLLKNATPKQLKKQCQIIGWEIVINS